MMLPVVTFADAVEINGIYYNLITKGNIAEVTSGTDRYKGDIVIPESIYYNGTTYSVTTIGDYAFGYCNDLLSVIIPNSIKNIGERAFRRCSGLKSVFIGSGVKNVDREAFDDCQNLEKVVIKDIATWCEIEFHDGLSNPLRYAKHLFCDENTEIKELVIPNVVKSINNYVFTNCSNLTSISLPNGLTSIGVGAFFNCTGLTNIEIPNSVTFLSGFSGCSGLTSIVIPNNVTTIGLGAFSQCSSLSSILIPNSVTSIGDYAFQDCPSLTSITIPNGVTSISQFTFAHCSGLTSIVIPNNVTTIGQAAFQYCSSLTTITLGSGIKSISVETFTFCPELKDVFCLAERVPDTYSEAFQGSFIEYATLHVPAASINSYKLTAPWSGFKAIVGIEETTPETQKCEKPTISYENGQLKMSCATEGVEYVTDITNADVRKHYNATIPLTATYTITVYATKYGYENSDVATATLCWIDQQPKTEGIVDGVANVAAKAVLIQSNGGQLIIEGVHDGETIDVYTIEGARKGSSICQNGVARIDTNIQSGNFAIVKIGQKSIKVLIK